MTTIVFATLKGVLRDRIAYGILTIAVIFLAVPSISSLSMRQVTELSINLSLSLISFILLLLSVFLGGVSVWKDVERRYTFSILGLPISRGDYLVGKFLGIVIFLAVTTMVLGGLSLGVVHASSAIYPSERAVSWGAMSWAILSEWMKYVLLVAVTFFFSTVSTSFFLPIFGAISLFVVGCVTQDVHNYLNTPTGRELPALVRSFANFLYYILPNFGALDSKVNAVYGVPVQHEDIAYNLAYFVIYTAIALLLSVFSFSRRELK